MKRLILLMIIIITSSNLIQAGGVGISPVYYKEFFEPYLEREYTFHSFNTEETKGVEIYVEGDLKEYVTLSTDYIVGSGDFTVTISLPAEIEKPGKHRISIAATESLEDGSRSGIGGVASIQGGIDIFVPYPGKYSESTFEVSNINQGENAPYILNAENLGTESLLINPKIEVLKFGETKILVEENIPESLTQSKETYQVSGKLDTRNLPPGEYEAIATIEWEDQKTIINQTLRIGEFLVEIIDYDYQFERGKINPFTIEIENKWNTEIKEVFASVYITDEGKFVKDFKTVSVDTDPWETKNITGYFDATGLETKRYIAKIDLSYGGESSSKLVAIYINDPPTKTYQTYIISAGIIIILVISLIIYLILKIKKLQKQNAKKK